MSAAWGGRIPSLSSVWPADIGTTREETLWKGGTKGETESLVKAGKESEVFGGGGKQAFSRILVNLILLAMYTNADIIFWRNLACPNKWMPKQTESSAPFRQHLEMCRYLWQKGLLTKNTHVNQYVSVCWWILTFRGRGIHLQMLVFCATSDAVNTNICVVTSAANCFLPCLALLLDSGLSYVTAFFCPLS